MSMIRSVNPGALKPDEVAGYVIEPALKASVFAQAATQMPFASANLRIPKVQDGSAAWTAEGTEIGVSDAVIGEIVAPAKAIKSLTFLSNELVADGNPGTLDLIGNGAAREIAAQLDLAAFGATTEHGPAGIESVVGTQALADTSDLANLDDIKALIAQVQASGYSPDVLVATPAVFARLAVLKESAGSNRDLLQPDATAANGYRVAGLNILVSKHVEENRIHIWDSTMVILGVRQDAELVTSTDAAFSSDRTSVRAVARFAIAFPAPEAIGSLTVAA
ncbi:phage major capsid protein [Gordonia sp. KTR9]|uniref:phage major capsid protein n=1 Tax=Gordonia sp. KTR9 TaxID=337191 RepID=UPI00027DE877|nr:phage major capsid protein [Gordonia sp. KTR9]AFR48834.1 phage major capsid protein [Gordonia sp. KTR9]